MSACADEWIDVAREIALRGDLERENKKAEKDDEFAFGSEHGFTGLTRCYRIYRILILKHPVILSKSYSWCDRDRIDESFERLQISEIEHFNR